MIDSAHLAEEEIKHLCRKDSLPEADEVESEWDALESLVLLNGTDDSLCHILGLEHGDDG